MLKSLITYLNLKLDLLNYFDLTRCLVELKEDSEGTRQPVEYISNGDYDVINWDEFNGVSYWRLRDEITSDRTEERKYKAGSRNNIETTVPLKLVFAAPRTKLTEDDAYSFDRIRQTMVKQFAIDDDVIKTTLQAESVRINVVTANSDAKDVWEDETGGTGTFEPKYETVFGSIDVDVVIISKHSCLPTECDDVESDILRSFDWCGNTAVTIGRLTLAQQTCISDFLCACDDATVENSDQSYQTTVASGGTLVLPDISFTDSDGSTSSVPSVQDIIATPCTPSASVSVALSNSTPKLGEVITITATVTGITPTSYNFITQNQDGTYTSNVQASNTFNWTVSKYDSFAAVVTATDGSSTGVGQTLGTTTGDVDSDAFITAHNAATGGTMDATMQGYTLGFFLRLKGINTTHIENVFQKLTDEGGEIYPMIPDDVSGTSLAGYSINAIDPSANATMVGFVPADATVNGLDGGTGKYMIFNNAPSDFGQNDAGVCAYIRSHSNFDTAIGATDGTSTTSLNATATVISTTSGDRALICVNGDSAQTSFNNYSTGFVIALRNNAIENHAKTNDVITAVKELGSLAPSSQVFYGMAGNANGSPVSNYGGSVSMLGNIPYLNSCEAKTLYEAVLWLQQQIGRNV